MVRGVSGIIALWLYFSSIQNMPLASAVSIQYTSPVFTAILATFLLKENMNKWKWIFFIISMLGVFLIKGFDSRLDITYVFIGLASAILSAIAYNCIRKLRHTDHPLVIILYFPMLAIPFTGIYSYFNWVGPVGHDWMYVLLMGLSTQAGQLCMTKAIQMERLENVTFLNYAGIFFALILGFVAYGEVFNVMALAGMVMVAAGIFLNLFEKKKISQSDIPLN